MKKIFLLLSVVGLFTFSSCNDDDPVVNEYYFEAEVFELNNVPFSLNTSNGVYESFYPLNPPILFADMVLVYRLAGIDNGRDVWELVPRTLYYTDGGFVDIDYNFTTNDILFTMAANFDLATRPELTRGQVFRVVIIPGFDNTAAAPRALDTNYDYEHIVKKYNIKESDIKQLTK